jgi:hypothetical protein
MESWDQDICRLNIGDIIYSPKCNMYDVESILFIADTQHDPFPQVKIRRIDSDGDIYDQIWDKYTRFNYDKVEWLIQKVS